MTVQNESERRFSLFVYIETVDSVEGALWLASETLNILCFYVYRRATQWRNCLHLWQVKKSSKLIFCGVYYLTVLVYTKKTIHLSVGG